MTVYTATARFGQFSVTWHELRPGVLSVNHKRLMPMMANEAAVFKRMQAEGKTMDENSHWVYGIQEGEAK